MSLRHALLGLLTYRPMTGYELKQFFDSSVQHFWNAELSQIYPTLKALEEQGFVDKHVEVQENRPNRKIYEITPGGEDEFLRWVRAPSMPADLRDPFLIKVFFGTQVPIEEVLILLRRQMEEQQMMLGFADTILRDRIVHAGKEHFDDTTAVFWTLTLEMAMAYRRAYIAWCEHAMEVLEKMVPDEPATLDA